MKLLQRFPALTAVILFSSTMLVSADAPPPLSELTSQTTSQSTASASQSGVTISNTDTGAQTGTQTVPVITGSATATSGGGLTGLPKLAGAYSYPPASVPPTQNAPYMQISSLPEGTVFIAVGAFLGFLAFTVLAWRGLVVWSLRRSVRRAALQQQIADSKAQFLPVTSMYKYSDRESTVSLGHRGKKSRPSTAGPTAAVSQSLFFSPTAGAAGSGGGGLAQSANRGSNYLPAGYYAAGTSAPGGGNGTAHIGGNGLRENISMSTLRPQSQGYAHSLSESPGVYLQRHSRSGNLSTSTLDLSTMNARTTAARAPSAYFEELMDESSGAPRTQHDHL